MDEIHDFDNTVVAILDSDDDAEAAVDRLGAAGYVNEVLRAEEGKPHLDPEGDSRPEATLKRLFNKFGDQYRVIDERVEKLDHGNLVVSVDTDPVDASETVKIHQDTGGEFIWKLGTSTYTRVGH